MTERRRPAAASRLLAAGGSAAMTLALVAAMAASRNNQPATLDVAGAGGQTVRVVITDPRIDPLVAADAARRAAAAGQSTIRVPVGRVQAAANQRGSGAAHTSTRSS